MTTKLSNIRQQFPLSPEVDRKLNELAEKLNKRPTDLRRDILSAHSELSEDQFYIALGKTQELSNKKK